MRKDFKRTLYRVLARLSGRVGWKWVSDWKMLVGMSLLAPAGGAVARDAAPAREAARFPGGAGTVAEQVVDSLAREDGVVFEEVEEEPIFPHGNVRAYVRNRTLSYPINALSEGGTGTVIVGFTVDEWGKVTDVEVIQSVAPDLDTSAMEVVAGLPVFLPGRQGGKPVRVKGALSIVYTKEMLESAKRSLTSLCYDISEIPDSWDILSGYISDRIVYPEEALRKGIKGNVYVGVTIRADGSVTDEHIVRGAHPLLDAEALRIIRELPRWRPAYVNGRAVDETYVVTVPFNAERHERDWWRDVCTDAEEMPVFPEGQEERYLGGRVRYPEEARVRGIEGEVWVRFVVVRDGCLTDVKVLRPVHPLLDAEALRVVREMPRWKPGRHAGKTVRVSHVVVVRFELDKYLSRKKD